MSRARIFPEDIYRKYVRPVLLIYPVSLLPFLALEISEMRQEMRRVEFLRSFDSRSYLLPVTCSETRGEIGRDYVYGDGRPIEGRGSVSACWYTLATYRQQYPERSHESDDILIDQSFKAMSIRKQRPSIGEAVFTLGFSAWVLAFLTTGTVIGFREWQDSRGR